MNRVEVAFCDKNIPNDTGFILELSLNTKYEKMVEAVAERVGIDKHRIQIFKCQRYHNRCFFFIQKAIRNYFVGSNSLFCIDLLSKLYHFKADLSIGMRSSYCESSSSQFKLFENWLDFFFLFVSQISD